MNFYHDIFVCFDFILLVKVILAQYRSLDFKNEGAKEKMAMYLQKYLLTYRHPVIGNFNLSTIHKGYTET